MKIPDPGLTDTERLAAAKAETERIKAENEGALMSAIGKRLIEIEPRLLEAGYFGDGNDEMADLRESYESYLSALRSAEAAEKEIEAEIERKRLEAEAEAERKRLEAEAEAERKRLEAEAEAERRRVALENGMDCPGCGTRNEEGVLFCQECGARLIKPEPEPVNTEAAEATSESETPESVPETPEPKAFCMNCGHEITPNMKFCSECGTPIKPQNPVCPQCGTEGKPGHKFCAECGYRFG